MSGDVQPRKRKDKKKKRDDEDIKESHHGVHLTKMGSDDVHLHVQSDHGTGGHWCAKIFFFSLLAILFGLVGLIILENRGLSDLDTPLSESRFSEYFDGWVDEHRGHDDHHETKTGLENHDQDAGPFEEEEDHSEQEEDESHDAGFHDDDEHDEEGAGTTEEDDADEEEEANKAEDDDDNDNENDDTEDIDHADDDNETGGDNDDEDDENTDQDDQQSRDKREVQDEDQDEEANDEGFEDEDNTSLEEEETPKNDETDDDDVEDIANEDKEAKEESTTQRADDDDAPFDEEDDDDFENESLEEVVDNDAGELLHLRQKAEQEELAARAAEAQEVEESDSAPLAVKIVVGLALALVARLVLVKKSKPTNADEPARGSPEMKRRFTMISAEDNVPVESEELVDEELDEEEYLEEEEEEDEQLQYSEDEDEEEAAGVTKFMPETFEQLNAMYRPKPVEPVVQELPDRKIPETVLAQVPASIPIVPQVKEETRHIVFDDTPQVNLVEPLNIDEYDVEPDDYDDEVRYEHDADEEVSDEDDADIYSGSEEDIDDEELSDVDDNELMKRLEEKYGKLPAKQYGSEEDDDEEPTWTKIRPNARGPQSYADEDEYIDEEIRRANEDLFNDQFDFQ